MGPFRSHFGSSKIFYTFKCSSPHCCVGFLFFLLHLLAPPPPSAFLLPPLHYNISHTTSLTTTSLRQHPTHNVSHTTSLTQHLSQQHLTHNSTHTTSLTQHLQHARTQTTSHTQRLAYNITHNIPHTTSRTQHLSHNISHNNITHTTSHTQRLAHAQHFVNLHVQISWQAQRVLCEPPCADLVAGTALCCLPRGRMHALASAGHRRLMCKFRGRRSTW